MILEHEPGAFVNLIPTGMMDEGEKPCQHGINEDLHVSQDR